MRQSRRTKLMIEPIEARLLFSTVVYVDAHAPGSVQDGASWETAYLDLQNALTSAAAGAEIRVADGIYTPSASSDVAASFQLKNSLTLRGGYGGYGAAAPDTIDLTTNHSLLSGQLGPSLKSNVVVLAKYDSGMLDGFYISYASASGSGLLVSSGSPTIKNCTFESNGSYGFGGGIYIDSGSPQISNCLFRYNGGAVYARNCQSSITNCTFAYNISDGGGAAINAQTSSNISVTQCSFVNNETLGGGSAISSSESAVNVRNCVLLGYYTIVQGSHSNLSMSGCTVFQLRYSAGQMISAQQSSNMNISNSIFWSASSPSIATIGLDANSSGTVSYSDVLGGWTGNGSGNINVDPQFITLGNPSSVMDLKLKRTSPCVDSGYDSLAYGSQDFAGNTRIVDFPGVGGTQRVDLGAFEIPLPLAGRSGSFSYQTTSQRISLGFNSDVITSTLTADDLVLTNLTTGQMFDCNLISTLNYSELSKTALWTFSTVLPDGNYTATLPAGSVTGVITGDSVTSYTLSFFVLAGDTDHDRRVDIKDLFVFAKNWQLPNRNFASGDFNYDHVVDAKDLGLLAGNWQRTLVAPTVAVADLNLGLPRRPAARAINLI